MAHWLMSVGVAEDDPSAVPIDEVEKCGGEKDEWAVSPDAVEGC